MQGRGCAVEFVVEGGAISVRRTNELGTTVEPAGPEVQEWAVGVLNAALKWRLAQGSGYLNAKALGRNALMAALHKG